MATGHRTHGHTAAHRRRAGVLGALVALSALAGALVTARATLGHARQVADTPRLTVDDAVPVVALIVLIAGLAWLSVVVSASTWELLGGPPSSPARSGPVSPVAGRVAALLLALTAMGSATGGTPALAVSTSVSATSEGAGDAPRLPVPDFAAPSPDATGPPERSAGCALPEPGWVSSGPRLQRPATTDRAGLLDRCGAPHSASEVVVHRGDSLWSIAERDLGPDATPREVAAAWPRWYAANRDVIGPDPDALLPGTTLHRPSQEVLR